MVKEDLTVFGSFIAVQRKAKGKPQVWLGEQLEKAKAINQLASDQSRQTFVARLEKGAVDPNKVLCRELARILTVSHARLIGTLVADKYGLGIEIVSPLLRDPLSLGDLATWESEQAVLWIVTEKFVDEERKEFRQAITTCLRKTPSAVTFFLPKAEVWKFHRYKNALYQEFPDVDLGNLSIVELENERVGLLPAAYVIANHPDQFQFEGIHLGDVTPSAAIPAVCGYIILIQDGAPNVAIQMSSKEISDRILILNDLKREAVEKPRLTAT